MIAEMETHLGIKTSDLLGIEVVEVREAKDYGIRLVKWILKDPESPCLTWEGMSYRQVALGGVYEGELAFNNIVCGAIR